ncbi:MAG: hypothetical protein J0I13_08210 [Rhizobiales bacterium]|jgi:ABC-type transport system substrate-binding protein|nr:hypothetical protein [Hyphomicrobiales bacterium]
MKLIVSVATLIVSIALAAPSEAATKKTNKKPVPRANASAIYSQPAVHPYDVYVSGEWVGRDPDPSIRSFMMRNPHIWDGPD